MAAAKAYGTEMYKRGHGLGVWVPEQPVDVGDVGFLANGQFHRLFNALRSEHDPTQMQGVPRSFQQLVIPAYMWSTNNNFFEPCVMQSDSVVAHSVGAQGAVYVHSPVIKLDSITYVSGTPSL
jgi:hypothetical protein